MNLVEELPRGLTGLEQLHALMELGGRPPIGETLDFTLVEAKEGFVAFESVPSLRAYNPIGTVHGGYAATLLDSACGCAAHSQLTSTQRYTTLELKVAYHKAITSETGKLRAEGRVLSIGRRAAFAEATLKDMNGKLYASATSTLLVIES
ncbi:PaaI family thioesterase [Paraburkholderia caribensis]|uniref:PaaI family thioesterase n=1 Tax=Paraburkholderia caribensis TaxID=75105 RepID=UPI001CAF4A42|nr:PaaI family thioesterase [Paraburkholderia caribensis]CAG9249556.1 Thioesterase [Paraburkholderia caribensis]